MANYLCVVSNRFPENYQIGLQAGVWGVEEKYQSKIAGVSPGDLILFSLDKRIRSIHRIESEVYFDATPLWPEKDGSYFPYRVKISPPIATGDVPLGEIWSQISFMQTKDVWTGTIQGGNGVFNSRLTEADMAIIRQRMGAPAAPAPLPPPEIVQATADRQEALFRFYEKDVEDYIERMLPQLGLELYRDPATHKTGRQFIIDEGGGRIDLLCTDTTSRDFVVLELKKGEAPNKVLLQILYYMSWVRQHLASEQQDVRGIIITESSDQTLSAIIREVPKVQLRHYRLHVELID